VDKKVDKKGILRKNSAGVVLDTTVKKELDKKRAEEAKVLKEWVDLHLKMMELQKKFFSVSDVPDKTSKKLLVGNHMEFFAIRDLCEEYLLNYTSYFKNSLAQSYLKQMKDISVILASILFTEWFYTSEERTLQAILKEDLFGDDTD